MITRLLKIILYIYRRIELWLTPYSKRHCRSCCLICRYFDNYKFGNCYEETFGRSWYDNDK